MKPDSHRASFPQPSRSRFRFCAVSPYIPPQDGKELRIALRTALTGGLSRGTAAARFAEGVRSRLGVAHALPLNRARSAIELALRALEVGRGSDVVLPAYVCGAVLEPILNVGARPVFAEVGEDLHVTPDTIEQARTPATRCVIVPHLFGNAAPIDEIEALLDGSGIPLLDDAAQSFGATRNGRPVGTFGACGVIGCGPGKALDGPAGGLLVTNDAGLMAAIPEAPPSEGAIAVLRRFLAYWTWFRMRRFTLAFKSLSDAALTPFKERGSSIAGMSNLEGALALHALERCGKRAELRRESAREIVSELGSGSRCFTDLSDSAVALRVGIELPEGGPTAEQAVVRLAAAGVECGENYTPLDRLLDPRGPGLPRTEAHRARSILLPAGRALREPRRWSAVCEVTSADRAPRGSP